MKVYESLFKQHINQSLGDVFAHFYPINGDYAAPFRNIGSLTSEGLNSWEFNQPRFLQKYPVGNVAKLKNYLNYTFVRLVELEQGAAGQYFKVSADGEWICFNTGLQDPHGSDLLAVFQKYQPRPNAPARVVPDWVFKGCFSPNKQLYRDHFGTSVPDIAWYSKDSRDFIFDLNYELESEVFEHLFDRAKERAGLPNADDEVVRNYLKGALANLKPKIRRNYKVAIPVYYVEEKRMQLLLPFASASVAGEYSCFLVERDDTHQLYRLKTIFDLDQAYFSARLLTRPDKDWLNP